MNARIFQTIVLVTLSAVLLLVALWRPSEKEATAAHGRCEVVFWHFWGGKDRAVVEAIVDRFNASQEKHFVRAVAMPGNNLDLKFFLAVTGGDPPDLLNQDDPVVADWAHRGAIMPLDEIAAPGEIRGLGSESRTISPGPLAPAERGQAGEREQDVSQETSLEAWLFPAARQLGTYNDRLYALCNGLDIRALYYDRSTLEEYGLSPPQTLSDLDHIAFTIAPPEGNLSGRRCGFLPNPQRSGAWGIVFSGRFYDPATGAITADSQPIVDALEGMASYSRAYGPSNVSAFRQGDQALTGAASPLLAGRYVAIMDGQWRVREIHAWQDKREAAGLPVREFGVVPLPPPKGGAKRAGWVNGNFFIVPRSSSNPEGAWEFMKFWSGFGGNEAEAARIAAAGGWIPASQQVVEEPAFEEYLNEQPLFREFVELARSPKQVPTPAIPAAGYFQEIEMAAENVMYRGNDPRDELQQAADRVRRRLANARGER